LSYKRFITSSAKRSFKKLPKRIREDILVATEALENNPSAGERLTGPLSFIYSFHFKSQNVEYRVAYTIDQERKYIIMHLAGPRENFYEKLRRLFK